METNDNMNYIAYYYVNRTKVEIYVNRMQKRVLN